jgi:ABC-type multidrug transport system fused ATPase/permease subunit
MTPNSHPIRRLPHHLWALLTKRERRHVVGFMGLSIVSGFAQMISIGSVLPFVGVMMSREAPGADEGAVGWLVQNFRIDDGDEALFLLGALVLLALLLANGLLAGTQWLLIRFAWTLQSRMSLRLLESYLNQPYVAFLARNSADNSKNVLSEVSRLVNGVVIPLLRVVAYSVMGLFLLATLLWAHVMMTVAVVGLLGGGYGLLYGVVRTRLYKAGVRRSVANTQRFKVVNEAFGSIKEMKLLGREHYMLDRFAGSASRYARSESTSQILLQIPRHALEVLAVSVMLFLSFVLASGPIQNQVPLLTLYGYAALRLLPLLRQIYQSIGSLQVNAVIVNAIYEDVLPGRKPQAEVLPIEYSPQGRMPFERAISLRNVSFQYDNSAEPSIQSMTLEIPKRGMVALVGLTGAGKTTLVDIILGLLRPQQGDLLIDGVTINNTNLRAWQDNIGYVPQDVFLMDDTIDANIAFMIPPERRNHDSVEAAAKVANIYDFVTKELRLGFDTVVGERGVRLSGGQRQRIGIARALYHDPSVLILDEATSNLDQSTEVAVHQAIMNVAAAKTVILIAHRLKTTEACDTLYLIDHGRLVSQGTYETLLANDEKFQAMANPT